MISWRKAKIPAVSAYPLRLYSLFRGVHGDAVGFSDALSRTDSGPLAGKIGFSHTRNLNMLSQNRCCVGFNVKRTNAAESYSTITGTILVQARDPAKLNEEIQIAVDEGRCDEAWRLFEQHMQMEGFPRKSVVNNLLICSAETLEAKWLEKAYSMVEQCFEESKQKLLEKDPLLYLSVALAKSAMAVSASTILRKLIEMEEYPPVSAWSAVLAYMSLSGPGAYLSAELVLEIGYLFQNNRVDPRKKSNAPLLAMKPNTIAFNAALAGCLLFGTTRKAEQLVDMMPRIGVKADADLLIIMAHIYERNGRREELRKLQRYIDEACTLNGTQFWQFYNCLLMCHLKLGDLESASTMVLEILRKAKVARNSLGTAILGIDSMDDRSDLRKGAHDDKLSDDLETRLFKMIPYEEFSRDRKFSKLEAEAKNVISDLVAKLNVRVELISSRCGILEPTEEIYVKLAKAYLESGKMKDLAEFLVKAEEHEDSPVSSDSSMIINVINACISSGRLEQAHDLLDEMRVAGVRTGSSVYSSLVKAYCKTNQTREVSSLLRDAQKAGIQLDSSCYEALVRSRVIQKDNVGALDLFKEMKEQKLQRGGSGSFEKLLKGCEEREEAGVMSKLLREIKEGQSFESEVHDWNNVIHFFSKKGLMTDAEKALKKMRSLGHSPNAQTFHSMVTGYAAIGGKYTEVTELWGEMKSIAAASPSMKFDQELLDSVLYTMVRGGFFSRANEAVEMMERGKMFIDKYKYRGLFLRYHKTLYKGKAPKFQTEAQLQKREAALAFKKWVGLS